MQIESEITVNRPAQEAFDYLAHAEYLPEYATDFESVSQTTDGEPGVETQYSYRMRRGGEGTFRWTRFEPNSYLAWEGPPVKRGPGSMQPTGWWRISEEAGRTRVQFVMAPTPGGLFKLLAPLMAAGMRRANNEALERLKQRLEQLTAAA